jgi:hypothetical protein
MQWRFEWKVKYRDGDGDTWLYLEARVASQRMINYYITDLT